MKMLQVSVWRGAASGGYRSYEVPRQESQSVLDVVTYIQRSIDPTLSYRFACRVGMCGACAMTVSAPLANLPVVKDLVTDMREFFDKWARARGQFAPRSTRKDAFARVASGSPERIAANAGIECIGCGVCYASCDVVSWNPDYLGPAALNRAWTLVNDVRDGARRERLAAVAGDAGCHACHTHLSCSERCPKSIAPTAAIAGLKRAVALAAWKGEL